MGSKFTNFPHTILPSALFTILLMTALSRPAQGQSSSACTGPMISNMASCISFLTSGSNLSRPTSGCCDSLRDLMSNGKDCLCLVITGGAPFQVPFNRNLAISLPRACGASGVPIKCKATPKPVPTPAQGGLSPPSTIGTNSPTPGGSMAPPEGSIIPTLTPPGMRPTLTPSTAQLPQLSLMISLLVATVGVVLSLG